MSDYLTSALPDYDVITPRSDGEWNVVPVIAWDHVSQGPMPITVRGKVVGLYAISYPDGRVWSRQSDKLYEDADEFAAKEGFGTVTVKGGDIPLRSLRISSRACAPLERRDIQTLGDLARCQRSEIAGIRGVSDESLANMDKALEAHGLKWGQTEAETDEDKDEMEDVL